MEQVAFIEFELLKGKKVLELGFGTGVLQVELAQSKYETYGLEYSKAMQKLTQQKLNEANLKTDRVQGDGRCSALPRWRFDHIVATFPEQYLHEEVTLKECCRVLVRVGVLL